MCVNLPMPISSASNENSQDSYVALFNHASMGIVVVNSEGMIRTVNPFALNLFGYEIEEIRDQPIEKLIPARYHGNHKGHRQKFAHTPNNRPMGVGIDLYAIKKNGVEFPVEVSLGNYTIKGELQVIAFISDISVRKKAEAHIEKLNNELEGTVAERTSDLMNTMQKLEVAKDKLEEAISFQKAILDNAGAMIIVTDDKGILKLFNPEASLNLGYKDKDLIGRKTPLLFHDWEEIEQKANQLKEAYGVTLPGHFDVLVEKAKRNIHIQEQYTYIRKNGTTFPVSVAYTAMRDKQNDITGFMCIAFDISERKKAEENLRESLKKERELSELKSRFVSMASHEFRTPLSTVLSSTYLIEKYTQSEEQPKREKHLQRIISSVNMLTDILNDFLSVGKIEEGKIQVRMSTFSIPDHITAIIEEIKNLQKNGQQITYQHKGQNTVTLDAAMLKHIVMNLLSNAIKFSPESGRIEVSTLARPGQLCLYVKDHGMGISKEDQQHLMERFFRGTNAGNIQGTGLGLHIVSKYAELMNGSVECVSELEKGTEFTITFTCKTD